jgi:putative cofactor-binding repeat protein
MYRSALAAVLASLALALGGLGGAGTAAAVARPATVTHPAPHAKVVSRRKPRRHRRQIRPVTHARRSRPRPKAQAPTIHPNSSTPASPSPTPTTPSASAGDPAPPAPITPASPVPASPTPSPVPPTAPVTAPVAPVIPPAAPVTPPAAPAIAGVTYYVSPSGSDLNSGTSPAQAWRTVGKVNSARLSPGDGVLFQGGQTFSDQVLMPSVSGATGKAIVFGSYGQGQATISQGAWFVEHDLAFENLAFSNTFYGGSAIHGPSDDVTLYGVSISLPAGNQVLGLYSNGDHWVIEHSQISDTGLSGMLLNGDDYLIADNTLTNLGLDTTNGYNNHGIYLDASDATITGNTITNFAESAVSVRYRNATITDNAFSGGQIGIDFYEFDTVAGTSDWTGNTISQTTTADLFVCGTAEGCQRPLESFTINGNQLSKAAGIYMNLQPIGGTYSVTSNTLG